MSAPVSEPQRLHLFKTFEGLLPDEDVATLMAVIPPFDWNEIATKTDLDQLRVATKTDLEQLRVATKTGLEQLRVATKIDFERLRVATEADFERLRVATKTEIERLRMETKTEIGQLRMETKTDLDQLRMEMKTGFDQLRITTKTDLIIETGAIRIELAQFRGEVKDELRKQTNRMVATVIGSMGALAAIFSAAVAIAG